MGARAVTSTIFSARREGRKAACAGCVRRPYERHKRHGLAARAPATASAVAGPGSGPSCESSCESRPVASPVLSPASSPEPTRLDGVRRALADRQRRTGGEGVAATGLAIEEVRKKLCDLIGLDEMEHDGGRPGEARRWRLRTRPRAEGVG